MLSELLTAISATTNLTGASVTLDSAVFNAKMGSDLTVGTVTFQYTILQTGWSWALNRNPITLSEYGLTFDGTPEISTTITVTVVDQWDEIKEALKSDNTFKYYHIYTTLNDYLYPSDNLYPSDTLYPGISSSSMLVIENDELIQESCKYTASLADVGNVQIGKCNAARFEFKTFANVTNEAIGQRIRVTMSVGNYQAEIPIGEFNITEVQRTDISEVVKVVAYDDFVKLDQDVSEWFNDPNTLPYEYEASITGASMAENVVYGPQNDNSGNGYETGSAYANVYGNLFPSVTYFIAVPSDVEKINYVNINYFLNPFTDKTVSEAIGYITFIIITKQGEYTPFYYYPYNFNTPIYGGNGYVDIPLGSINAKDIVQISMAVSIDSVISPDYPSRVFFNINSVTLKSVTSGKYVDLYGESGFIPKLCNYVKIPTPSEAELSALPNYNYLKQITRPSIPNSITARYILEQFCVANGVFAIIDRIGGFKFISINNTDEEDLTDSEGIAIIKKARAESFDTIENASVYIISGEYVSAVPTSTVEREAGTVIKNNMFIDSIQDIGDLYYIPQKISEQIEGSKYTPATVECRGLPYLDLCDKVKVNVKIGNDKQAITTRVINRTMNGIQGLMDTIKGTGTYNTKNIQSNN